MSSKWRVLDFLDYSGTLEHRRGKLRVNDEINDDTATDYTDISLADVALILLGDKCHLSTGTLHYLANFDVVVLICDWRRVPEAIFLPIVDHSRIAARQIAQKNVSVPKIKQVWAEIVRNKIYGQHMNLVSVGELDAAEKLKNIMDSVRSGDKDNKEAQAARIYWRAFFTNCDFRRNLDATDFYNSALNYAYTVLRGHGIRAVLGAGLNPVLGLCHKSYCNNFNLVDDIIEPFRPAIDAVVRKIEIGELTSDVKKVLVAASTQKFTDTGIGLSNVLENFAGQLGQYFEDPKHKLVYPSWKGTSWMKSINPCGH